MVTAKFQGFSVACHNTACEAEFTLIDDILGGLEAENIQFCPFCGERLD